MCKHEKIKNIMTKFFEKYDHGNGCIYSEYGLYILILTKMRSRKYITEKEYLEMMFQSTKFITSNFNKLLDENDVEWKCIFTKDKKYLKFYKK